MGLSSILVALALPLLLLLLLLLSISVVDSGAGSEARVRAGARDLDEAAAPDDGQTQAGAPFAPTFRSLRERFEDSLTGGGRDARPRVLDFESES